MKKILSSLLCFGLVLGLTGCGGSDDTGGNSNNTEKQEDKVYGLNEEIVYSEDNVDLYSLKITSVKETKERNEYSDIELEQAVLIEYVYENLDSDEDIYIYDDYFTVIDEEGNVCATYPIDYKYPSETPKGAKCTASAAFAIPKKSSKIKVRFKPPYSDEAEANFELEVK